MLSQAFTRIMSALLALGLGGQPALAASNGWAGSTADGRTADDGTAEQHRHDEANSCTDGTSPDPEHDPCQGISFPCSDLEIEVYEPEERSSEHHDPVGAHSTTVSLAQGMLIRLPNFSASRTIAAPRYFATPSSPRSPPLFSL